MNALLLERQTNPSASPALTDLAPPAGHLPGLRLFKIVGDIYEPELRGGCMLMVAPVKGHPYDGEYLLDFGDGEAPYRAGRSGIDTITIWHPNPRYSRHKLTDAEFRSAVTAIVVAEVKVKDERLIRRAYAERVAA